MTVYCDSDSATDTAGRKSCSGGVLLLAGVPVTFWTKSQSNIALSSGEAELNSSVKAISETLGVINLWEELMKSQLHATVRVDSSACKGMLMRNGIGRMKHLSTRQLWVQSVMEAPLLKRKPVVPSSQARVWRQNPHFGRIPAETNAADPVGPPLRRATAAGTTKAPDQHEDDTKEDDEQDHDDTLLILSQLMDS